MTVSPNDRLRYLLTQYARKRCTAAEMDELLGYMKDPAGRASAGQVIDEQYAGLTAEAEGADIDWDFMYRRITAEAPRSRILYFSKIAAAVLLLVAAGLWVWLRPGGRQAAPIAVAEQPAGDALPGSNKAMLVLADGSSVELGADSSGLLGHQGNASINKTPGRLTYSATGGESEAPVYNKVATPRGGQYQLTLADGTKVWLNSASSIRFPVAFSGSERLVEITGEAYFEVAKMSKNGKLVPFRCMANQMEVAVLGTHFNVNAYDDEPDVRTTLLEGAVQVKQGTASRMLAPGQQARLGKDGNIALATQVNLEEVMGWKEGYFVFVEADIRQIMRQVEKWYNVEVVYEGAVPDGSYTGRVPRNINAKQMMKVLELSGIKFRIAGSRLLIRS